MLPGNSSKTKNDITRTFGMMTGGKKNKQKKHFYDHNNMNEILLQYNLEKMNEDEYEFDRSSVNSNSVNCDVYPFASTLSKDYESLLDVDVDVTDVSVTGADADTISSDSDSEDNHEANNDEQVTINLCIYQINTSCELPFIEFLMVSKNKQPKKVFEFPNFDYVSSKRTVLQQAEDHVMQILSADEVIKCRGYLKHAYKPHISSKKNEGKNTASVYLFYQKFFKKLKHPPQLSIRDDVWWIVTSEIVNYKKVMYMDIDTSIYDLFIRNPEIMHLYDCKGRLVETPTVCYFGDQFQKIKYLAFFGLLKAPIKSSFGPFYVATNFLSSMKYACYTHDQKPFELYSEEMITTGKYGKYKEGGVLRMVLFIGKMKVFLKNGPPDDSQISEELAKTDESIQKLLALRDSNGNWTEDYDTAYSGLYFVSVSVQQGERGGAEGDQQHANAKSIAVNTVEWFFKNYNNSAVISYHNIDTSNIPDKFDVDFTNYMLK